MVTLTFDVYILEISYNADDIRARSLELDMPLIATECSTVLYYIKENYDSYLSVDDMIDSFIQQVYAEGGKSIEFLEEQRG